MVLCLKNSVQKNEKKNDGIENTNIGPLMTKKKTPRTNTHHTYAAHTQWHGRLKIDGQKESVGRTKQQNL